MLTFCLLLLASPQVQAQEPAPQERVTLDSYHPFQPPATLAEWEARRESLRTQVLLAAGLWGMPARPPIQPVIHGAVDRGAYTVEKVYFASLPGHYMTGNLYRPTAVDSRKLPAVLSPHGHWADGRFTELAEEEGNDRWPLQARCAQLARMGCVVFHYDMVGYGDSTSIEHGEGFKDADSVRAGQTFLGLQLWNSIRALDFLAALPEVDARRIGVTGASGGGTQTVLLCAVDNRPAAAFPAVMVSTAMQGGCVCENAPYLRLGTGNVELAALFAPKPLALSGANDWTVEIETKGLPELKALYGLYGAEENVTARCWPELDHNYNRAAREMMYAWFNEHLRLGIEEPIVEETLEPLTRDELTVFEGLHPRPPDDGDVDAVKAWWRGHEPLSNAAMQAAVDVILPGKRRKGEPFEDGVIFVVVAEDEDVDTAWYRSLMQYGTVRRIELPEAAPPIDEARHGSYVGYSWGYNPTSVAWRAGLIRDELITLYGWKEVRFLCADRRNALASALALARLGRAGDVDHAALLPPDGTEVLPGVGRLGGFEGLLHAAVGVGMRVFDAGADHGELGAWLTGDLAHR